MHLPLGLLNTHLRLFEKPAYRATQDVVAFRKRFVRQAKYLFRDPPFTAYLPDQLRHGDQSVSVQWANCQVKWDGVILYLHGGGYSFGAPQTHRAMLARLSKMTGLRTVLPDYRLAPEHAFPAAVIDAETAYCALLDRGYRPNQIILGGDSAGGGLMLALLHKICTQNLPMPAAVFAFSPWTDMTLSGHSLTGNAKTEALLPAEMMSSQREVYLAGADPKDPCASPLFGNYAGAPAVLIQVGDSEILLDDSSRMAGVLKDQKVDVTLEVWPNAPHVWQIFQGLLNEADQALLVVAQFIDKHIK